MFVERASTFILPEIQELEKKLVRLQQETFHICSSCLLYADPQQADPPERWSCKCPLDYWMDNCRGLHLNGQPESIALICVLITTRRD